MNNQAHLMNTIVHRPRMEILQTIINSKKTIQHIIE